MSIKSELASIKNKRVLLRVDYNVPMSGRKILDDFKIRQSLPTIRLLLRQNNTLIMITHLGRPSGRYKKDLSVKPLVRYLNRLLSGDKVKFIDHKINNRLSREICENKKPITFLENIRFNKGEKENSKKFVEFLASLADVYVNEAFAGSHREHASNVGVARILPSYLGLNFQNEIDNLGMALKPPRPGVAIIGGAKIESKFSVIKKLLGRYDYILTGGGAANTFLKARGYDIGDSICGDEKMIIEATKLLKTKKIILPNEVIVADVKTKRKTRRVFLPDLSDKLICHEGEQILDIGPRATRQYIEVLKKTKFAIWSGPLGLVDLPRFRKGSLQIAKAMATQKTLKKIAGGGETVFTLRKAGALRKFNFVSTGGGAMLYFLEGRAMPGIEILKK